MLKNYDVDKNGVIYQKTIEKLVYDEQYVEKYNNISELVNNMSHLRLGYIVGMLGSIPDSILDVGYGNGSFLKTCNLINNRFGFDVSGYKIPDNCKLVNSLFEVSVDVVTFFDSLEHFDDPYVIKDLNTKYIVVSLPECHYFSDAWFESWKHRRPNEHLWHFNKKNLLAFMENNGYSCMNLNNMEDTIRKNNQDYSNILTGCFKKI